jgi:hypothetical protein
MDERYLSENDKMRIAEDAISNAGEKLGVNSEQSDEDIGEEQPAQNEEALPDVNEEEEQQ